MLTELLKDKGLRPIDLARKLDVDKSTVSRWEDQIPLKRVFDIERETGIPRSKLRPDYFGDDQ